MNKIIYEGKTYILESTVNENMLNKMYAELLNEYGFNSEGMSLPNEMDYSTYIKLELDSKYGTLDVYYVIVQDNFYIPGKKYKIKNLDALQIAFEDNDTWVGNKDKCSELYYLGTEQLKAKISRAVK